MESLKAFNEEVLALESSIRATQAIYQAKLEAGTQTNRDLRGYFACLTGYKADIRALRAELDLTNVEAFLVLDTGENTLAVWGYERDIRHFLTDLGGKLQSGMETTEKLIQGQKQLTHTVKSGETWQKIAAKYLGDWREWPKLLEANPSLSAAELPSGTSLIIPGK